MIYSSCSMNEWISRQPVLYGPLYKHNICLHQQKKHLQKLRDTSTIHWNFPNCIKSVHAKHIRILCPSNFGSQYFNYKQRHSIVLQAVVDGDLWFVAADAEAYGKQIEVGFFQNSDLYQTLEAWSLKWPVDTVLPRSEITFPHILLVMSHIPWNHTAEEY
jgi:hypothetical protein